MGRTNRRVRKQQPKKDSKTKRVNFDNARVQKVAKAISDMNDIVWYSRNPELLKAAGSVTFAQILGENIGNTTGEPTISTESIPGIMELAWAPTLAANVSGQQALYQATNAVYSFVVHANSRNYAYEATDLMVLVVAAAQVFALIANPIRAFGAIKYYEERNLFVPDGLLKAMGFDAQDFRNHLADIWFQINDFINQLKQIWVPNTMPLFTRWFWMSSNIYKDADDPKGQIYVFTPSRFLTYNATRWNTGGSLETLQIPASSGGSKVTFNPAAGTWTWEQWKTAIQTAIDNLLASEDRGIIFGDILNAYGPEKIFALNSIPSDYVVEPVYNAEVLTQIENATVTPYVPTGLLQINGYLRPVYSGTKLALSQPVVTKPIVNFHFGGQPSPESVVIATRLTAAGCSYSKEYVEGSGTPSQQGAWITDTVGTEAVTAISVWRFVYAAGSQTLSAVNLSNFNYVIPTTGNISEQTFRNMGMLMSFDWHPFYYYYTQAALDTEADPTANPPVYGSGNSRCKYAFGDYDNYTFIEPVNLAKLHRTCLYSLLGVPTL